MSTAPAKCTKRFVDTEQGGITMRKSSKIPLSKDMHREIWDFLINPRKQLKSVIMVRNGYKSRGPRIKLC